MKAITKVEVALIAEKLKFVVTLDRFYNHIKQTQRKHTIVKFLWNVDTVWISFDNFINFEGIPLILMKFRVVMSFFFGWYWGALCKFWKFRDQSVILGGFGGSA